MLRPAGPTDTQARIGGQALLPASFEWPKNPKAEPLVLIASLPSAILNEELKLSLPDNHFVSVFTTYNKSDYFLDVITYFGANEELANIQAGYTKVLIHEGAVARNESNYLIPAHQIALSPLASNEEATYSGSKIGGQPVLLQNEALELPNSRYILQFYSGDFPDDFEDIFYLSDAVGYLYLTADFASGSDQCDVFFVQST